MPCFFNSLLSLFSLPLSLLSLSLSLSLYHRYAEAKGLGERVNSSRVTISESGYVNNACCNSFVCTDKLKSQLEKHRLIKGIHG